MRTIEEVKEWLVRADKEWALDSQTRPEGSFERGLAIGKQSMANYCLEFIDSAPPCRHQEGRFYAGVAGEGYAYPYAYKPKFCPDCGEKLQ